LKTGGMATEIDAPKLKTFPFRPRSPRLARLMQSCAFILAVNWCLQGMRGMDRKELAFRLGAELLVALLLAGKLGIVPALLVAHTLSFTFNGQVWVGARYCRFWRREPETLDRWLASVATELQDLPWLREAACIGSRGDLGRVRSTRADLDLRLVFPRGIVGWLKVNLLLLRLRSWAFLTGIPLDLYAYDNPASLQRFNQGERLLVLLDRDGKLAAWFPERVVRWPG
jgi:hypothetical protein